jgi:hypothetical protein
VIPIEFSRAATTWRAPAAIGRRCAAIAITLSLSVLAATPGCGGSGEEGTVPAAGIVKFKGKPLEKGTIQFVPATGRSAHGNVEDGKFTLTTYNEGDGAIPGKHQVGIVATKEVAAKKKGAEPESVLILPKNFASPGTSNIEVDIPATGKKDIEININ